jgi:hypothetical protein
VVYDVRTTSTPRLDLSVGIEDRRCSSVEPLVCPISALDSSLDLESFLSFASGFELREGLGVVVFVDYSSREKIDRMFARLGHARVFHEALVYGLYLTIDRDLPDHLRQ